MQGSDFISSQFISKYIHIMMTFASIRNLATVETQRINIWIINESKGESEHKKEVKTEAAAGVQVNPFKSWGPMLFDRSLLVVGLL